MFKVFRDNRGEIFAKVKNAHARSQGKRLE